MYTKANAAVRKINLGSLTRHSQVVIFKRTHFHLEKRVPMSEKSSGDPHHRHRDEVIIANEVPIGARRTGRGGWLCRMHKSSGHVVVINRRRSDYAGNDSASKLAARRVFRRPRRSGHRSPSVSGDAARSSGHTDPTAWLLPPPSLLRWRRRTLCRTQSMGVDTGGHLPCATADGVDDDAAATGTATAAATKEYARSVSVSRARTPAAGPSVVSIGVSTRVSAHVRLSRQSASVRGLVVYAVFFSVPVLFCFVSFRFVFFKNFPPFAPPPVDHPLPAAVRPRERDATCSHPDRFMRSTVAALVSVSAVTVRDALRAVPLKTIIS